MKKLTKNKVKAWVPVKEVKTTMESEKEEERSLEEEKRNKILSSLPPNYVTLAQLRENWMKKKQNEVNQERHVAVATPQYGAVSRFCADNRNREDSVIDSHAIGVDSEDLNGKVEEGKPMKKKKSRKQGGKKEKARKGKMEENGAIEEGSGVEEIEQEFRVLSVKSGNWKIKNPNGGGFRQSQSMRNDRNAGGCHGHGDLKADMIWVKKEKSVGGN